MTNTFYLYLNIVQDIKKGKAKTRMTRQKQKNEYSKSLKTNSKLLKEEVHVHCVAHCKKCSLDTFANGQMVNCQICSGPLEYHCAMCNKQFLKVGFLKNHIIKGLEEINLSKKCKKCHRSFFSSQCSLSRHQLNCNMPFCFDKEVLVNLVGLKIESELFKGNIIIFWKILII